MQKTDNCRFTLLFLLTLTLFLSNCKEEVKIWNLNSEEQVASEYIANNSDKFSEFSKLIESTELNSVLKLRGPYTVFLPTNDAMFEYYKDKGVSSYTEFSAEFRDILVRNHIVPAEIQSGDIGLGAISEQNTIGDFLVSEFHGADIIINKTAKIIKRDILTANGYIHVIDKVIEPLTKDIYSVIAEDPSFKIFAEGLKLTGLSDTLQIISFPYGQSTARSRFTVLVVPDSIFQKNGITSIDELIKWCGASTENLNSKSNPFYRYIEYHCLNNSIYLSNLNTGIYPILSRDNNIAVRIDDDYKLNLDSKTGIYTSFILEDSNIPAKNGAIHAINNLLPVIEPEPAPVIFETTDFFDIKYGDWFLKYYMNWGDGQNTFAKIKWEGEYLQYYYKPVQDGISEHDCLSMKGWWTLSITFPKVMKGKYAISIYQPTGWTTITSCRVYLDGELTPYIYTGPRGGGTGGLQKVAEAEFTTTAEHTITLQNIIDGGLFWDYVRFDPIK